MAQLERSRPDEARSAMGLARALGGIQVDVEDQNGAWHNLGSYAEAGPIATGIVVLPLEEVMGTELVRLRLRMAKGAWRVNWTSLALLGDAVVPVALEPDGVERRGEADTVALRRLRDPDGYLVTYPGDDYRISYRLPDSLRDAELFLESQGYYYEWMRQEWMAEEDPAMAALMLLDPDRALRRLAPDFKRVEPRMERLFWASRFGR